MTALHVHLADCFNNVGCTPDGLRARGDFDGWSRSFPLEELSCLAGPNGENPDGLSPDNVSCEEQRIALPAAVEVARCRVVGAAEGGSFAEPLVLLAAGGAERRLRVALSDWLAARPSFGEECLIEGTHVHEPDGDLWGPRPHLWISEAAVDPPLRCVGVRLPANPSLHIFGITLLTGDAP